MESDGRYECVEPQLGELLWQFDMPDVDPRLRQELAQHLTVCDACRFSRAVEERVATGLKDGSLDIKAPTGNAVLSAVLSLFTPPRQKAAAGLRTGGVLAVAACLALILWLPPVAPSLGLISRAEEGAPSFDRPVSEEIVLGGHPQISYDGTCVPISRVQAATG
ncbi:hypothetical protein ACFL6M_06900 [Candidatus Eisenbacteria bacterium]|uniref:Zinc-finger domain-containing protein n=1 Tax=Eiseniibacteriota bacterium TaxID=2212470 RepID=A0ABV6YLU8_UNCEI